MSAITIENDLVHYEVLGRGRPVVLIHGWLGSWRYWVPTMQQLSIKFRTYALDLWGFGDSGKNLNRYTLQDQVQLLNEFMEKMGITKAALVGHSYGAAVAIAFARKYPDRAPRVVAVSPPLYDQGGLDGEPAFRPPSITIVGPDTQAGPMGPVYGSSQETLVRNPLKGMTAEELAASAQKLGESGPRRGSPLLPIGIARSVAEPSGTTGSAAAASVPAPASAGIANNSSYLSSLLREPDPVNWLSRLMNKDAPDFDKLKAEIAKIDLGVYAKSAVSVNNYNLAAELRALVSPTLLVHGAEDTFMTAPSEDLLMRINKGKPKGTLLPLVEPKLGHFPMLENAAKFNRLMIDFLEAQDLANVQFKDQWIRVLR